MKRHFLKLNSDHQALLLAFLAYTAWCLGDANFKYITEYHLPAVEITAALYSVTALTIALFCCLRGKSNRLKPKKFLKPCLRGLFGIGISLCNYATLSRLPLPLFNILTFCSSFWIAIGGSLFFREPMSWRKALLILAGFVGVVISVDPLHATGNVKLIGIATALLATVMFTCYQLLIKHISDEETPESLIFCNSMVIAVLGWIIALHDLQPLPWVVILHLFMITCASITANMLIIYAIRLTHTATFISMHYTQIITSSILSLLIWHEWPGLNVWVGAAIVTAAGLGMVYLTKRPKLTDVGEEI